MTRIHSSHPPATDDAIEAFERELGQTLPASYRAFLQHTNGGKPTPRRFVFGDDASSVDNLFALAPRGYDTLASIRKLFVARIPETTLAIGRDPGGGLILLGVKGLQTGKVYFWDAEFEADDSGEPTMGNLTLIADDFSTFLDGLHERIDDDDEAP